MPKARRDDAAPTQLRNAVATMVDDADLEMILRVARRYGLSKSGAARLLIRAGAAHHDPSPPSKETA
jgi:hypothetical protein